MVLVSPVSQETAEATPSLTLEATYPTVQNGWDEVERWQDNGSGFLAEDYPPDGRGNQEGQRLTFFGGVEQPSSSRFLLYHAPGWDTNPVETPVLLVHGANDNADRAWANPNELGSFGCGEFFCPSTIVAVATEGAFDFWENKEDEEWNTLAKE